MLRSIGSATVMALLMVGCGGGGGGVVPADTPPPPPVNYTVGATVTGLTGSGLVLMFRDNALSGPHAISLAVAGPGGYTFSPAVPQGSTYTVYVGTQPSAPAQTCTVTDGAGTVGTANVTTVAVACSTTENYTVRGTVSGLVGSGLTLEICPVTAGGGPRGGYYPGPPPPPPCTTGLQVGANGAFTLDSAVPASYSLGAVVSITQQPTSPWQRCRINNARLSSPTANDTGVTVSCTSFSYVTNAADNTLSAYSIDPTTGALAIIGTPIVAGVSPYATAVLDFYRSINRYVFVGNEGSNDVSAFVVDNTTGALNAVPGSPFPAGKDPKAMAIVGYANGYNLYVANAGSDNVSAYAIDMNTGALTALPGSSVAVGQGPTSIVADPRDRFVFVANHGGSNDISAFTAAETVMPDGSSQINLNPVPGSPFPAGGSPLSLAVGLSVGGNQVKFLYSANPDATHPSISGFSIDPASGALSPLSGSPFPLPVSHYIATDQSGSYLYVTSGANILGYRIDATTGALTPLLGFPVATGANAYSITIDPTNQFLYVANDGAANITGFKLNYLTGALSPMSNSPFPAGSHPQFIATSF